MPPSWPRYRLAGMDVNTSLPNCPSAPEFSATVPLGNKKRICSSARKITIAKQGAFLLKREAGVWIYPSPCLVIVHQDNLSQVHRLAGTYTSSDALKPEALYEPDFLDLIFFMVDLLMTLYSAECSFLEDSGWFLFVTEKQIAFCSFECSFVVSGEADSQVLERWRPNWGAPVRYPCSAANSPD